MGARVRLHLLCMGAAGPQPTRAGRPFSRNSSRLQLAASDQWPVASGEKEAGQGTTVSTSSRATCAFGWRARLTAIQKPPETGPNTWAPSEADHRIRLGWRPGRRLMAPGGRLKRSHRGAASSGPPWPSKAEAKVDWQLAGALDCVNWRCCGCPRLLTA